jgi:hypothetical protein
VIVVVADTSPLNYLVQIRGEHILPDSVRRFRPAVIIIVGLTVKPGLNRLRSRWWRGVPGPRREF